MLIVIACLVSTVVAQRLCYDVQGKYSPDKRPCKEDGDSICCGETDLCLSNNACLYTYGNVLSRGTCTDPSWTADACQLQLRGGGQASLCDNTTIDTRILSCYEGPWINYWYCNGAGTKCDSETGEGLIFLKEGYLNDPQYLALETPTTSDASATSIGTDPQSVPASTPEGCVPISEAPGSTSDRARATIGASIGVPLAVLLGCVTFWALRERHFRRRAESAHSYCEHESGGIANEAK